MVLTFSVPIRVPMSHFRSSSVQSAVHYILTFKRTLGLLLVNLVDSTMS